MNDEIKKNISPQKYFGTDGIRGTVNRSNIKPDKVIQIAMAAGRVLASKNRRNLVVIGKDTRLSGYMIETAMTAGFNAVGIDVVLLGPVPTPALAMLTSSMRADIGVMITASHNPFYDNGIKFFDHKGFKIDREQEKKIEDILNQYQKRQSKNKMVSHEYIGRTKRLKSASERYVEFVKRTLKHEISFRGFRVVIDCANGAGYVVSPKTLWELGAEVIDIATQPNGVNINQYCGSVYPDKMCQLVTERRADIGIALDGDADRVVFADEKGKVVSGDIILAIIADYFNEQKILKGNAVVSTIMANIELERYLNSKNIKLYRTEVGDKSVQTCMIKQNINLGGEPSGHVILADFATTADGLLTAIQVMAIIIKSGKTLSQIASKFNPVPQKIYNVKITKNTDMKNKHIEKKIKQINQSLKNEGRLIIRESGTENLIRIMIEAEELDKLEPAVKELVETIENPMIAG